MFPVRSVLLLSNFAELGFVIFQFLVGVKMDPKMIFTSGRKALVIGILPLVIPGTLATTASVILANNIGHLKPGLERMLIFVGAAQSTMFLLHTVRILQHLVPGTTSKVMLQTAVYLVLVRHSKLEEKYSTHPQLIHGSHP